MTDETTTSPEVMAGDVITQPGLYESRGGDIVRITGWDKGWWVSEWHETLSWYGSDGRQRFPAEPDTDRWDLARWVAPLPASEQLAEIEPQPEPVQVREGRWRTRGGDIRNVKPTPEGRDLADDFPWWDAQYRQTWRANGWYHFGGDSLLDLVTYLGPIEPQPQPEPEPQATEFTPPEGWRLLEVGETLQEGDVSVRADGHWCPTERVGSTVGTKQRYIRPIDPQPQPQPEPQATDYTPPDGWRLLETHEELDIPGRDQYVRGPNRYIRPIEPQPELPADTAEELRSEVSYVQNLLGESRQRVTQLEELVASLETINTARKEAAERANRETEKLALQWAAVREELKIAAAVSQQLQIELDAAQQVPADSPELRQLRSDLAEVTRDRDEYRHAHGLLVQGIDAGHERTRAETVEAIIEWLQPFRGCNSPALALLLLEALPHIMRSLTGLADEEIE